MRSSRMGEAVYGPIVTLLCQAVWLAAGAGPHDRCDDVRAASPYPLRPAERSAGPVLSRRHLDDQFGTRDGLPAFLPARDRRLTPNPRRSAARSLARSNTGRSEMPFGSPFHLQRSVPGKANREQISGKRSLRETGPGQVALRFPFQVPNGERTSDILALRRHAAN